MSGLHKLMAPLALAMACASTDVKQLPEAPAPSVSDGIRASVQRVFEEDSDESGNDSMDFGPCRMVLDIGSSEPSASTCEEFPVDLWYPNRFSDECAMAELDDHPYPDVEARLIDDGRLVPGWSLTRSYRDLCEWLPLSGSQTIVTCATVDASKPVDVNQLGHCARYGRRVMLDDASELALHEAAKKAAALRSLGACSDVEGVQGRGNHRAGLSHWNMPVLEESHEVFDFDGCSQVADRLRLASVVSARAGFNDKHLVVCASFTGVTPTIRELGF